MKERNASLTCTNQTDEPDHLLLGRQIEALEIDTRYTVVCTVGQARYTQIACADCRLAGDGDGRVHCGSPSTLRFTSSRTSCKNNAGAPRRAVLPLAVATGSALFLLSSAVCVDSLRHAKTDNAETLAKTERSSACAAVPVLRCSPAT